MIKAIIIYFLLLSGCVFSQNISIEAGRIASDNKDIYKLILTDLKKQIVFYKRDSISKKFDNDKRVKKIKENVFKYKKFDLEDPKFSKLVKQYFALIETYSYYSKKKVNLSKEQSRKLKEIITIIENTPPDDLEIKDPSRGTWTYMDGVSYKINLPYKAKMRTIRFRKIKQKFPLLYELVILIEDIKDEHGIFKIPKAQNVEIEKNKKEYQMPKGVSLDTILIRDN